MTRTVPLGLALLALGLAAGPATAAAPVQGGAPAPPEVPQKGSDVLVVGDSLAVGIRPLLGLVLPERQLEFSVRSGITTPDGMGRLRSELRRAVPRTVVISLGTNDGPSPARFRNRVQRTLGSLSPETCVVWPAVHRAARKGAYAGLNRVLREEARIDPRLTVPGWDRLVDRGSVRLPDGVHPDSAGYERRARLIAGAVRRGC